MTGTVIPIAPTAEHTQHAFTAALALTSEPAEDCPRARLIALAALCEVFRTHGVKKQLAGLLGFDRPDLAANALEKTRTTAKWWRDEWVDDVTGALVSEQYGDRAQ